MLSRRHALASLLALSAASAQQSNKPVRIIFDVTDSKGHYILGLEQQDFRILEDGIVQKIDTFDKGVDPRANSYVVTYTPAPNPNRGFRWIEIRIVSDPEKRYRVRAMPGYRPT